MELNSPSLDYVYNMTWAEFQIRAFAYKRMQEKEDLRFREVAYHSHIGGSLMLKKIPSKDKFWQIGDKRVSVDTSMYETIKKAQEQYFKELKEKQNGIR